MTILITGAASGIGYASALTLARRGHNVIATGKTIESLEQLRAASKKLNVQLQYEQLDITEPNDLQKVTRWPIDVLMSNAAIGESGPLVEIPLDRFRRLWETNVVGTLGLNQIVAQQLIAQRRGRLIIVGSTAGLITVPSLGPYCMTKFALEAAADTLRMELKQFNIFVSLIEPGKIATGFNQKMTQTKYQWLNEQSAFASNMEHMKEWDERFFANEYPVRTVVKSVIHAVESKHPHARYITPSRVKISIKLAQLLPDRLRDWVLLKKM